MTETWTAAQYREYVKTGVPPRKATGAPQRDAKATGQARSRVPEKYSPAVQPERRTVHLTLPWPPSGNKLWRTPPGSKHPILSQEGKAYYAEVKALVAMERAERRIPRTALTCRCFVVMNFVPPDRRTRDAGNMEKVIYDALTRAGVWLDDVQGNDQARTWGEPQNPGRVEIVIMPWAQGCQR